MKKAILLLISALSLLFLSCTLPASGRMGALTINISQSDIYTLLEGREATPDRILLHESEELLLILYPDFSGNTYSGGQNPTQTELDAILNNSDTRTISLSLTGDDAVFAVINDLDPGTWNALAYTFRDTYDLSNLNMSLPMTRKYLKGFTIEPGYNQIDVPLMINPDSADYASYLATLDVQLTSSDEYRFNDLGFNMKTVIMALSNMPSGECRIPYNMVSPTPVEVTFYDSDGFLINLDQTVTGAGTGYWTYTSPDTSEVLYIAVRFTTDPGGMFGLEMIYTGETNPYNPGPPPIIPTIEIYRQNMS